MEEILIANLTLDTYYRNRTQPLIIPTGDYGARVIRVHVTTQNNPVKVDVDSAVSIVATRNSDGESQAFSGRADDDGSVIVPVVQWMLEDPQGDVECNVVVTGNGYQYSTNSFLIQPQDKANPTEISEDDPRVDVVTEVIANENVRQAAESIRTQNENLRIDAENLRNIAEKQRLIDEEKRIENETQRISAENYRDTTFKNWSSEIALLPNMSDRISRNDKRITNLEQGLVPSPFVTDDSVAYIKDIPLNALPFAEISKIGGMTYKNGDTLKSAPVTEVKSVGANLLPFPYNQSMVTNNGVTYTVNADGSVLANGTATEYTNAVIYLARDFVLPAGTYTFVFNDTVIQGAVMAVMINGSWFADVSESKIITLKSGDALTIYLQVVGGVSVTNLLIKPRINKGSTAQPYTPYVERTLPIPEEVRPANGINENVYDYIEWAEDGSVKKTVKCGVVDMGTIGWTYNNGSAWWYSNALKSVMAINYNAPPLLAENYKTTAWADKAIGTINQDGSGNLIVLSNDSTTKPSGLLYYELAEPIDTDISDLISADNFIGVEGNGTLTFKNAYEYAVPSEVEYQLEV